MREYARLIGSERWVKLTVAAGREIAHRALDDCQATLEVIRAAYKPKFTEKEYEQIKLWDELPPHSPYQL
jgi:hypothetical protein